MGSGMIDHLPLDLFDGETTADTEGDAEKLALCQWCGVEHPADRVTCPDCGATLLREIVEPEPSAIVATSTATPLLTQCPWCNEPVTPEDEQCQSCFAMLRGDPNLVLPGVNVPLPESMLWAATMAESELDGDEDPTDTIMDLMFLVGEALLKTGGRL
jgi:hypothetical protein